MAKQYSPWKAVILRILGVLFLFSVSRLFFYFLNTDIFGKLDFEEWFWVIAGGVRFDIVATLYINLLFILLTLLPTGRFSWSQKIADVLFIVPNAIGLLLNCIDTAYYTFNLKRITWTSLGELQGFNNASDLLLSFLVRYWYVWAAWLILCFGLVLLKRNIRVKSTTYNAHTYVDVFILMFFICMFGFRGNLRYSTRPLGLNDAGKYVKSPQNVALVYSTPFSIFRTMREKKLDRYSYFEQEEEMKKLYDPEQKSKGEGEFKPLNVVILVLESFSEEASSISNTDPGTNKFMPFVDSLRRKSFYTEYSFANGKKSIEALPAIWGSIPSYTQPYVLSKYSSNKIYGLPHILKEKGYHTSFFHGAPNGSMGFQSFTNLMGIEHYYGKDEFGDNSQFDGIWGIWDQPFLAYYGKMLKTFPQPFFSTIFTVSSHDPFKVPKEAEDKYPAGPHPIFKAFSYSDDGVRKFFASIKNEPWFNNTLFVITADHTSPKCDLPEFKNSVGVFRIPIFFYLPGSDLSRKSDRIFQQTDIMPTVLQILNYQEPYITFGKNLLADDSPDFAVNKYENYQYISGDYILKLDAENKGVELYKFKTDKLLKNNLIQTERNKAEELERNFKAYIQQFQNRMIDDRFTYERP
ncbi:LTA synthase family protein [Leadbetterella byssophila]|uniref:LTA synthase family protein n=1 Tax=Leadbetterella byssophila TaxID=316068 RepID=UPI0039A359E7